MRVPHTLHRRPKSDPESRAPRGPRGPRLFPAEPLGLPRPEVGREPGAGDSGPARGTPTSTLEPGWGLCPSQGSGRGAWGALDRAGPSHHPRALEAEVALGRRGGGGRAASGLSVTVCPAPPRAGAPHMYSTAELHRCPGPDPARWPGQGRRWLPLKGLQEPNVLSPLSAPRCGPASLGRQPRGERCAWLRRSRPASSASRSRALWQSSSTACPTHPRTAGSRVRPGTCCGPRPSAPSLQ